jgi:hypothetical protein
VTKTIRAIPRRVFTKPMLLNPVFMIPDPSRGATVWSAFFRTVTTTWAVERGQPPLSRTASLDRKETAENPVQVHPEKLRRHYASLSGEALLAVDRTELTHDAQMYYDEELADRGPLPDADGPLVVDNSPEPDWLEDAFCVCAFAAFPGVYLAPDAAKACEALKAAGIPCHISTQEVHETGAPQREYRVMVPGGRNLEATSVLDQKIFNPEIEADWKTHLQELSDDDFHAMNPELICAGLLDRPSRLKKAYDDELARRTSGPSG